MENNLNSKRKLEDETDDNSSPTKKFLKKDVLKEEKAEEMKQENDEPVEYSEIKSDTEYTRATESDVGISEYICDLPGFSGVIKERYSDFLVNEIDWQGNVVRLTNLDKPSEPEVPNKSCVDHECGNDVKAEEIKRNSDEAEASTSKTVTEFQEESSENSISHHECGNNVKSEEIKRNSDEAEASTSKTVPVPVFQEESSEESTSESEEENSDVEEWRISPAAPSVHAIRRPRIRDHRLLDYFINNQQAFAESYDRSIESTTKLTESLTRLTEAIERNRKAVCKYTKLFSSVTDKICAIADKICKKI